MKPKRRVAIMIELDWPVTHHHHMYAGVQRFARECGHWETLVHPYAELSFTRPGAIPPDGVVARATSELARLAREAKIPVVNVWYNSPTSGLPSVFHNVAESGRMVARHLLARGFHSFAYIGFIGSKSSNTQCAAFKEHLASRGFNVLTCFVNDDYDHSANNWVEFQEQLAKWMDSWPNAIGVLSGNDLLCRYVAEVCRERGLEIPQKVALVGSGNEVLVDTAQSPTLSSIDYGYEHIGYRAAELLDSLMDGAPEPSEPILLTPLSLNVRQSSDVFVVEDELVSAALHFIQDHLHEDIDVEAVAAHAATTRRTLSRHFNDTLHMTIHEAITRMRIDKVKRLLVETDTALKTIASECGFRDAIHLCKVFHRVEGTAPSEYRAVRDLDR